MSFLHDIKNHIAEHNRLIIDNVALKRENLQYKRWLNVALRDCGGIAKLKKSESIEDFDDMSIAFGSRECHFFDYYANEEKEKGKVQKEAGK